LHNDTCQWGQNPEIAQVMWVGTQSGKNAADIGALQSVSYLHAEEAETDVPKLPKTLIRNLFHDNNPILRF
jgi:hypothetical protein